MKWSFVVLVIVGLCGSSEAETVPSLQEKTKGFTKLDGFFPLYWDEQQGKLWLEIAKWETEFLYVQSLPNGIGSNDIGLDRGQLGTSRVVFFRRVGPKVLLVQPNYAYRALTDNADERKAVEESFAQSVLHGFEVAALDDDRVLVDATNFFLADAHDVVGTLQKAKEGSYKLDASRSAIHLPRTKGFPDNTDAEAMLTFVGTPTGKYLDDVTPTPRAVTVHQHHSLIRLPGKGYRPRAFHPQCGYFWTQFKDFATPLGSPMDKRYILRHRLRKKNPDAEKSEAVEPIVYYLDRGVPEPVRSALLDGARWWSAAFEEAGYVNAFRVEMLPEGVDPMDVRYNIIQWVHRSTRGWSYGSTIADPRTGEILKGHVSLGSLRVRQDMRIAEGLLSPFTDGKTVSVEAREMALARLRQLSAHEVGHTLGLAHNFAASTKGNASVMDYPHPYVTVTKDDTIDVSKAYSDGVGAWDKHAIRYGYSEFPEDANEVEALRAIRKQAHDKGLEFISDRDARPVGGAHPKAHLWDNGSDPVAELGRLLQVRHRALAHFGESAIPNDMPMALLEERLVPVYLLHRYQVEAVVKLIGGLEYSYSSRGERSPSTVVSREQQSKALEALLSTLKPSSLAVPKKVVGLIPPRPQGYDLNRELFPRTTDRTFDPLAAAESNADHIVSLILHPARCARLVEQHARNPQALGLSEVLDRLLEGRWKTDPVDAYLDAVGRTVDNVILYHLMALVANDDVADPVRELAMLKLTKLESQLDDSSKRIADPQVRAHWLFAFAKLRHFRENPNRLPLPKPVTLPPGSPIGACHCCGMNANR